MHKSKTIIILLTLTILSSIYVESVLAAQSTSNSSNYDWPMFRYDPAHTGATNSSAPTSMVREVWSTGPMAAYLTSPAIVDDVVYMTGYNLFAYNASTGEIIWQQMYKGNSPPVVENGIVYTTAGAFNALTGIQLWSTQGLSTVTVADGYYYSGFVERKGDDSFWMLAALNASTGKRIWNYTVSDLASPMAVAYGYVYFGSSKRVLALDAYTGAKFWETEIGTILQSSPVVSDGYVYLSGEDNNVYSFDALTGEQKWNSSISGIGSSPAVAKGSVFVGSMDGNVYALNASSGAKIWNYTTSYVHAQFGYGVQSSPVVTNDAVYVGADDGYLYAFNASTGVKLWSYQVGDRQQLRCSPAIANGRIYMGSKDNFLMALESSPSSSSTFSDEIKVAFYVSLILIVCIVVLLFLRRHKHLKKQQ